MVLLMLLNLFCDYTSCLDKAMLTARRDCYLHGYISSGIMKQVRENPRSGLAITIAATKVDGIVLSLTPNSHSYNYRSAVLFGFGSLVEEEEEEEKLWAMELVTNSVVPGRWWVSYLLFPTWRKEVDRKTSLGGPEA